MSELTYEDFKQRVNIQELLQDAGYHLNRRDGLRYPSYVRLDSDGRRIRGDKFIVTANGLCCFQPPERRNYNVISFIKEHPELFKEYVPGMSKDRLVNLVCNRLLNRPVEQRWEKIADPAKERKPFRLSDYQTQDFNLGDWESQKKFYPYFKARGIDLTTQRAFSDHFFLATKQRDDGKRYTNLFFPMTIPGKPDTVVGLEERSRPNAEGKTAYKGMAAGTDATHGMWIANIGHCALEDAKDVYWFESAFDAMAYYQLYGNKTEADRRIFVSTGGSPSQLQFMGMLAKTPDANHHLCFDRDMAGLTFAVNFALTQAKRIFTSHISKTGKLVVLDSSENFRRTEIDMHPFDFKQAAKILGIEKAERPYPDDMAEYVSSLKSWDAPMSGDEDLLPERLGKLYGAYESLAEEYESERWSGLVCAEDFAKTGEKVLAARDQYKAAMSETLSGLPKKRTGYVVHELPEDGYKDWNDQLLGKKMDMAEEQSNEEQQEQSPRFHR